MLGVGFGGVEDGDLGFGNYRSQDYGLVLRFSDYIEFRVSLWSSTWD